MKSPFAIAVEYGGDAAASTSAADSRVAAQDAAPRVRGGPGAAGDAIFFVNRRSIGGYAQRLQFGRTLHPIDPEGC
jgi:hypothetical protein